MALTSHIPTGEKKTDMVAAPIKFWATFGRQKRDVNSPIPSAGCHNIFCFTKI